MFLSLSMLAVFANAPGDNAPVTAVGVSTDGRFLCVARGGFPPDAKTGEVGVWDLSKPALVAVLTDVGPGIHLIQPTADGKRFVLAASNNRFEWYSTRVSRAEVWDVAANKRVHAFEVDPKELGQLAVSPDGMWVAYDHVTGARKQPRQVVVWSTDTGKRAEEVTRAATASPGTLAFTADSKRLVLAAAGAYLELDIATGKQAAGWKRDPSKVVKQEFLESPFGFQVAPIPGGKGIISASATGKRRQSYIIRLMTEKKDWRLGEFWDHVTAPVVSPDGRWIAVKSTGRGEGDTVFVLHLDSEGNPEMEENPKKIRPPGGEASGALWKEWPIGAGMPERRPSTGAIAFTADGKRAFTGGPGDIVQVWDPATREKKAILEILPTGRDRVPAWRIATMAGEYVGTPSEIPSKTDPDPAKVKAALGVK